MRNPKKTMNKRSRYLVEKINSVPMPSGKSRSTPSAADIEIPDDVRVVFEKPIADPSAPEYPEHENDKENGPENEAASIPDIEQDGDLENSASILETVEKEVVFDDNEKGVEEEESTVESVEEQAAEVQEKEITMPSEEPMEETDLVLYGNTLETDHVPEVPVLTEDIQETALMSPESARKIRDTFKAVREELRAMPSEAVESHHDALMAKYSGSNDAEKTDMHRFVDGFPGMPLESMEEEARNFYKYYANLTTDEGGDVFEIEFAKRTTLYWAMSRILGTVPISLVRLLLIIGAKLFVVAFYAIAEGLRFNKALKKTVFHASPGLGVNVDDVFDDYISELYQKGCHLLELDADFRNTLAQDCISYQELLLLADSS